MLNSQEGAKSMESDAKKNRNVPTSQEGVEQAGRRRGAPRAQRAPSDKEVIE